MKIYSRLLFYSIVLGLFCATIIAQVPVPQAPAAYKFVNGQWFDGKKFKRKIFYSVNGVFTDKQPARPTATVDLQNGFIIPPLADAHCHHIERLMVLGNFMQLCEFDPNEVHRWFMEMFIDAYDWVMVPNVYGMSQFADGGLMATKPYISGSNYLMKMSDFPKGDWQKIWDALFWRFMDAHRDFFLQNPRLGMLVRMFDKMPSEKRFTHLETAENYLAHLGC